MEEHQASSVQVVVDSRQLPGGDWVTLLQRTVEAWFSKSGRDFPWRQSLSSFHVLVAEVLLRRTQAERVAGPYLELIERYPSARDMADADVAWLREWFRPLGLVGRADLLIDAARAIVEQHGGEVPRNLSDIEKLPGLGKYSARAVHCLAHGGAVPMIDESSGRLLRRLLGLSGTGPAYSDRKLRRHGEGLVPHDTSRAFNLGLLDIAAAYCHVSSPNCVHCPLTSLCTRGRRLTGNTHPARVPEGGEISSSDGQTVPAIAISERVASQASFGWGGEA